MPPPSLAHPVVAVPRAPHKVPGRLILAIVAGLLLAALLFYGAAAATEKVAKMAIAERELGIPVIAPPTQGELNDAKAEADNEAAQFATEQWWVSGNRVVRGLSCPGRITASPAEGDEAVSDRYIGTMATETTSAWVAFEDATIKINLRGFTGQVAYRPINFIKASTAWAVDVDGKPAILAKAGSFMSFEASGNKLATLSCVVPKGPKNDMAAVDRCGIDEVVFLPKG